ncbi:MAG TPA: pyruvate kinase [Elusimicrobiota bacterium]|nr:pyruvate kinase [Elusimicrobiota bacterium]
MSSSQRLKLLQAAEKRTKILSTLGPASANSKTMKALIQSGVNAFRLNCSHATMSELSRDVRLIRQVSASCDRACSIVLDLQGPRLRVGRLRDGGPVSLKRGERIRIVTNDIAGTQSEISTSFRGLPRAVTKGSRILVDDGSIVLEVLKVSSNKVDCEIVVGGLLKEHKGLNLPGADIDLPALTRKDLKDLRMGLKLGVDHVALSFVRSPDDLRKVRRIIKNVGASTRVIAKIEHPLAIVRIDSILAASDGIMVARGDLAVELSPADVPAAQKQLVRKANHEGKLCIVATQMLESMITRPMPTRAEASDVANAIYDGADVVMLSGETAVGQYPVEAVSIMSEIIRKAEQSPFRYQNVPQGLTDTSTTGFANALARASGDACEITGAEAVVVYTLTGWSAQVMSKYRPKAPIYALTPLMSTYHKLALYWGITPIICPLGKSTDQMLGFGERIMLRRGLIHKGQSVLITAGGTARHKASNMLKIHVIGSLTYR